jgi:aldehyde dehydrogenase (NAD+)
VEGYCLAAGQQGASAVTGGRRVEGARGHFMQPTVFAGVMPDMTIAREEVFGPVLAVQAFEEPEEAIALANGTDYGLCAGVYTKDLRTAHWAADRLVAGQVFVNEWFAGGVETPFGNYVQTKNIGIRLEAGAGGRPGG